jgi:anti-sigma factor RsiW
MTLVMRCDEKDRLVGYLYDEASAAERAAVEAHLSRCAACAAELEDLKGVRGHLAGWHAPEIDLGFRVTREPVGGAPARGAWALPLWAQAAAAVLVLAAGAGLANLEIQYGSRGLTVRTGWGNATAAPAAAKESAGRVQPNGVTTADLRALEERLARTELALRASGHTPTAAPTTAVSGGNRDVGQEMRALLADSEERQRKEFALRLAQVFRDLEAQRSTDLVRIEQNLRQLEGVTGEQMQGQHEMINYLRRVSSQRP